MLTTPNDMPDELLVSYLLKEASEDDREKVEQWLLADPLNRKYFGHFRTILEASEQMAMHIEVDENEAWKRFQARTRHTEPGKTKTMRRWLQRAAILFTCVTALALAYYGWNRSKETLYASHQEPKPETLPDGSLAILNKNSEINYSIKNNTRNIKLKGEAFFEVKPDKNKPFIVDINDVRITVLGTSFNIKNAEGVTEVIVETGSVKVEKGSHSLILKSKERTTIGNNDTLMSKEKSADELYNYYRTHEFVCDGTPLWKLAEALSEAYNVHIIIEDGELRNQPLTTTFSNESLDSILNIISQTFEISVERRENKIILKKDR